MRGVTLDSGELDILKTPTRSTGAWPRRECARAQLTSLKFSDDTHTSVPMLTPGGALTPPLLDAPLVERRPVERGCCLSLATIFSDLPIACPSLRAKGQPQGPACPSSTARKDGADAECDAMSSSFDGPLAMCSERDFDVHSQLVDLLWADL